MKFVECKFVCCGVHKGRHVRHVCIRAIVKRYVDFERLGYNALPSAQSAVANLSRTRAHYTSTED